MNNVQTSNSDSAVVDIERPASLVPYLRAHGKLQTNETPDIQILTGGVSNKTVEVKFGDGRHWVLKQTLSRLRVQSEWFSDPARIHREAAGMRALGRLVSPAHVTRFIFEDVDAHVMAMVAVPEPRANLKTLLLQGEIDRDLIRQLADILAAVHRESSLRQSELAAEFADQTYFESLRIEPYFVASAGAEPSAAPFLQDLIDATHQRRYALVHGDYSPKNFLVSHGTLVLLDHEVIHWGDPAFDIGFCTTHLLSKAHHLHAWRRAFINCTHAFHRRYLDQVRDVSWTGDLEAMAVRHALGCLLARVVGRSPLEYLTVAQRVRQKEVVLRLMRHPPTSLNDLVEQFDRAVCLLET
jgi:aminoglycoside phosphotransferase (APT) family kinase protein